MSAQAFTTPLLPLPEVLASLQTGKLLQQGWSPQCLKVPAASEGWGVLKTTAIQPGEFWPDQNKQLPANLVPRTDLQVQSGDLLLTCAGPRSRCGIATYVEHTPPRLMLSGKMYRFRANPERVLPRFLAYYLQSPAAQQAIDGMKTGVSESGLNLTHDRFLRLMVPVPALEEQHRIVDLLDDHFSRMGVVAEILTATQIRARQVLASYEAALLASTEAEPRTLGSLAVDVRYGTSERCSTEGSGPLVLRIPNVSNGEVNPTDAKFAKALPADSARNNWYVRAGELLVIRTNGSIHLLGRSAVVPAGLVAGYASYLIRFRFAEPDVMPHWVHWMLNSQAGRNAIESLASSSAGQHNISGTKLKSIEIPVPEVNEMKRLLDARNDMSEALRLGDNEVRIAAAKSAALRRSILQAAFTGQLTREFRNE